LFEILLFLDHWIEKIREINHASLRSAESYLGTDHFLIEKYINHLLYQIANVDQFQKGQQWPNCGLSF
jgi:hypothetical protein